MPNTYVNFKQVHNKTKNSERPTKAYLPIIEESDD